MSIDSIRCVIGASLGSDSDRGSSSVGSEMIANRPFSSAPYWALIAIALGGLLADQISKIRAFAPVETEAIPHEIIAGWVTGVLAINDGAMGNLGGGYLATPTVCAVEGLFSLAAAVFCIHRYNKRLRWSAAILLGVVAAGVLGNAVDRLALGYVRDFLTTPLLPLWIFNLADIFILFGTVLLLGSWFLHKLIVNFVPNEFQGRSVAPRPTEA